ncbi:hypothetical protein CIHG_02242 [Coccidioides immitis H538.4]|uniref:Uncharacterized protein n=2 Tax=Coccidioides immitis TaxID=5501 RepID=A0A0J8RHU0_COCIT|nr:hypothetical protein CIRG_00413 [Coccidioides immitis RMSCC 2394]KMU84457.1 hypothetical protein CIHG_02242 [Coccidioides immitis H538.4]
MRRCKISAAKVLAAFFGLLKKEQRLDRRHGGKLMITHLLVNARAVKPTLAVITAQRSWHLLLLAPLNTSQERHITAESLLEWLRFRADWWLAQTNSANTGVTNHVTRLVVMVAQRPRKIAVLRVPWFSRYEWLLRARREKPYLA